MTISKAQLQQAREVAYASGKYSGIKETENRLAGETTARRFRAIEDALINLNGLAQANAQLATSISRAIDNLMKVENDRP